MLVSAEVGVDTATRIDFAAKRCKPAREPWRVCDHVMPTGSPPLEQIANTSLVACVADDVAAHSTMRVVGRMMLAVVGIVDSNDHDG